MKYTTAIIVNVIVFLVGVVLVLLGLLFEINKTGTLLGLERAVLQSVLISVGCSMIASAIITFIMTMYLASENRIRKMVEVWGICGIEIRSILNQEINNKLESMSHGMDIIALGMKNLIAAKGALLESKVKKGCVLRILTINPDSPYVAQRELEENEPTGQIRNSIRDLIGWAEHVNALPNNRGCIEVRTYDGLTQDTYQRVDDSVYVGPLLFRKPSQQTIAYAFKPGSRGAQYFQSYFESLWDNKEFAKTVVSRH